MKRILHVIGHLGKGGDSSAVFNIQDYILDNNLDYEFYFLTYDGYDKNTIENLKKNGVKIFIIENDVRKYGVFKYYKEIRKILKNNQFDVIHFHTSFQSAVGLYAAKKENIKVRVCHSHTTKIQRKTNIIGNYILIPICRKIINCYATKRIACSKTSGEFLFGKNSNFEVIYNGINVTKFNDIDTNKINLIRNKYKISNRDIVIGQVGRFDENKNQMFSIELIKTINDKNIKLILLGDGEKFDELKKTYESEKNIFFVGKVNDVNNYMNIFDILLLPSKYGEGLPVTLIEEQISNPKCLCLASDIVTSESNIGNVEFLPLIEEVWKQRILSYKKIKRDINFIDFDIYVTAEKWLNIYN